MQLGVRDGCGDLRGREPTPLLSLAGPFGHLPTALARLLLQSTRAAMLAPTDLQRFAPADHEDYSCWRPLDGLRLRLVGDVADGDGRGDSPGLVLPTDGPSGAQRRLAPDLACLAAGAFLEQV